MMSKPCGANNSVLIVGAGPVGLSLACLLADAGIPSRVLDVKPLAALADPAEDGREIALTQRSIAILQRLGAWQELAPEEKSPLRRARVFNGRQTASLLFEAGDAALGTLVSNDALRRVAHAGALRRSALIALQGEACVTAMALDGMAATVSLADGRRLQGPLLVAADSRFSTLRRLAGIPCELLDFGRSVQLARIAHQRPHQDQALECFHHGHTMAWLPLGSRSPCLSSLVLTLPADLAETLRGWEDSRWLDWVQTHAQDRLGNLRLAGPRHQYPLVASYARRFAALRFALVGDAAVGMHPVTAHGYNFGLYGAERLAEALRREGVAEPAAALERYADGHRRETRLIYQGTNAVVRLFTAEAMPARLLRRGVLDIAQHLPPLKQLITARLTERAGFIGAQPLKKPRSRSL
ncbi:5-demethoxyubiquinol-8 5-hydroxylase UbiM [Paucibacter sp. PLA-PC-4]|uniref:5-demethoxyubiquinol-8 5-hydroxylase UbiM n=1 Tax=Paucibacter sp. PLA-PC-4 TaxID=2993655 RepID=UPI00224B8324|nr:5-demethoxyubiquinol-8 5-hydroxylase UbiM [Paucibacter sp. PLA-PC-4]MCX2865336.1 5-demethoxyubiquinol-8 5-hydroxylase UbiM [Paucibacter sp. PLA-PC-4]